MDAQAPLSKAPPSKDFVKNSNKALKSGQNITNNLQSFSPEQISTRFYLTAKSFQTNKQNIQACDKYQQAEKLNFPLKDLLIIKKLETCFYRQKEFTDLIDQHQKVIPLYARKKFYKVALQKALTFNIPNYQASILTELASYEKTNEGKVGQVQKALELVNKNNNKTIKNKLNAKLLQYAPRFSQNPAPEKWYEVARDYERVRQFTVAKSYYQKVINSTELDYEMKVKAHWRSAMCFKVDRDKDGYTLALVGMTKWLLKLLKSNPTQEKYSKDYFKYQLLVARSYWTQQDSNKAMKILTKLLSLPQVQGKGNTLANILWLRGSIYLEWKKYNSAILEFQNAFDQDIDDPALKQRISWSLAWTFYSKGKYILAIHYFKAAINKIDDQFDKLKYKFWQAKSHQKLKQKKLALELYKDIIENSGYGYYGILSHNELGDFFTPMAQANLVKAKDNELSWLIVLDELDLAKSYLKLKRAGVKVVSYTDLYHPDTNIKLGARYLKDLQIKKNNKFVLYVSSYNASERTVNGWMKSRFKGDYLEFIERIPYKETRNYVKLVLRNYINYKRQLSSESFLFPKKFFTQRLID